MASLAAAAIASCNGAASAGPEFSQPTETTAARPERARLQRAAPLPLGVADTGVFEDLDSQVVLPLPPPGDHPMTAVANPAKRLLVLYDGDWPVKVYPTGSGPRVTVGGATLALRPGDAAELSRVLASGSVGTLPPGQIPRPGDADDDGIPDPLDLLIGARKTALNRAAYGAGYIKLDYPGGDVPRDVGVCTDVVIRATRNLGIDIQREVHRDIRRARRAYPMVRRLNKHINHRRVKTLLPYFRRHWDERAPELRSATDPVRPGDIVFMDTFPSKTGPDHIGVVSDRRGDSGHLLVINNWTDGAHTGEMDLLSWVPVTHRFRVKPAKNARSRR